MNGNTQMQSKIIADELAPYSRIHPYLNTAHKHDFYHLLFFTAGSGHHTIDFERFPVKKGQVYFMVPGQVHSWSFSVDTDGYIINFSEAVFQELLIDSQYPERFFFFKGIAKDSVLQLSANAADEVEELMRRLTAEVKHPADNNCDMVVALLMQLFITVQRDAGAAGQHSQPQQNQLLLLSFRKLVEQYYTHKHLPKEYAAMLYITPNYLNGICKDMLGKSAGQVIRDRILLEAKRLLVNAEMNVEEIAAKLHFSDNSYFTKFFKKYTGYTPDAFRRQSLKALIN
ncbi:MAG: helix-turn-helix domain-containing protein [Bacteroidetes bacterium]|nr:helix-turn-helix domain-containing protein [Bacteroidota bacterium]